MQRFTRSSPTVFFFIFRSIKKRRKASSSVAADTSAPDPHQPYQAQPAWPLYAAGGYGAPAPAGMVLAKHPPVFAQPHRAAGVQRGFSDPGSGNSKGIYSSSFAVPRSVAQFYEGTAPPLSATPPPSARQASAASSPIPAAAAPAPSYAAKGSAKKSNLKPNSRHK